MPVTSTARPILIAGATASGKSALAIAIAERVGGLIINADSMQVYRELRILTARPPPMDEAHIPHRLYGHVPAREAYSVARWLDDVASEIGRASQAKLRPIIVGGTGLYFKALTEGLSPVPAVPAEVRAHWRQRVNEHGANAAHVELSGRDPVMARRLQSNDGQRIARALEVLEATGRSLADWQQVPGQPIVPPDKAIRLKLDPPREWLAARCDSRFDLMMAAGAMEEVRGLADLALAPGLPVLGALGVGPLLRALRGEIGQAAAIAAGKIGTRQYVKRQQTWLKRNMVSWNTVQTNENGKFLGSYQHLIDE